MKEILKPTLTNQARERYSRNGDVFMTMEGKPDMTPANSQPTSPEHAEKAPQAPKLGVEKPVSSERQAAAREAWDEFDKVFNKDRIFSVDERRVREEIIKRGLPPIAGGTTGVPPDGEPPPAPPSGETPEGPEEEENTRQEREPVGESHPIDVSGIIDTDSLNLIFRFNQEIGYLDKGRIDQLKRDLSERINNLTTQRLSQSTDTEAGAQEIERLEAEITRLRGVFPDLDEMSLARQGGERMSEEERALFDRTTKFLQDLRNAHLNPDDIANLTPEQKVARASLVEDIEDFIRDSNPVETGGFPSEILRIVRYFKELREGLISELIFKSYEDPSETGEYEMDLYASSNLNTLLGFLSRDEPERYRYFFSLKTAAHYFHAMNGGILTGNFERFGRIAETINYQHFRNMEEIKGTGPIMRLYEQKYKYYLGKDKRITEDGYAALKRDVEKTFREMNKKGLVRSEYEKYSQRIEGQEVDHDENPWEMKDWEINRALGAGRAFFNITLRGAENISTGQIPEDRKQFASFPQEDMVRVLNWNEWFLRRFRFGSKKHGVEFLGMVTDKHQEFMKYMGEKLDPEKDDRANRIIEFGGVNVRKMENGGQYHTSGVYSGWRMENLAFDRIRFDLDGRTISIMDFMDKGLISTSLLKSFKDRKLVDINLGSMGVESAFKMVKGRIEERLKKDPNMDPTDAVKLEDQEDYRDIFMPLVNNLDIGLSMLIKNSNIGGTKKLGYLLREEIWRRIANKNTSLMIDYLTGLEAPGTDLNSLEKILEDGGINWNEEIEVGKDKEGKEVKKTRFEILREKVLLRHERMIREVMGEGDQLSSLSDEEKYTPEEKALIDKITKEGEKLAPHLADIMFPYMPFMNDIPFEKLDYSGPGQTFYKRRTGGDLNGFNKGQQAFMKIMSNPGGVEIKDAMEAMHEIIEGISSPEGDEFGMESNFPTFESLLDIAMTKKGSRNALLKAIKEFTRNPTSRAQEWSGIKAASIIEGEVSNLLDTAVQKGLLPLELARYMKRKKNATLLFILWMLLRDVVILSPAILATEFGSELMKSGK